MRSFFDKIQLISRWFVLAGVLAGLFFSSGEGIQLFPFPGASDGAEKRTASNGKDKPYSFSILNSSNHSGVNYSKVQKNLKFLDCVQIFKDKLQPAKICLSRIGRKVSQPAFYSALILFTTLSDRAPPAA